LQLQTIWKTLSYILDIYSKQQLQMKLTNLIENNPSPRMKILITTEQFQALASSLVSLLEQEQIIKTYLINNKPNGKQIK